MNRTEALIKGLQILSKHEDCDVQSCKDRIFAGPDSHRDVSDEDAFELDQLGWYVDDTMGAWAFSV